VISDALAEIGHENEKLYVVFRETRAVYVFYEVPASEAACLMNAPSKGHYFDHYIKGRYDYARLDMARL